MTRTHQHLYLHALTQQGRATDSAFPDPKGLTLTSQRASGEDDRHKQVSPSRRKRFLLKRHADDSYGRSGTTTLTAELLEGQGALETSGKQTHDRKGSGQTHAQSGHSGVSRGPQPAGLWPLVSRNVLVQPPPSDTPRPVPEGSRPHSGGTCKCRHSSWSRTARWQ